MSFEVHVVIEGLDELEHAWADEVKQLEWDLDKTALVAARAGVEAVREDHPYTDRTYQLTETARALPHTYAGDEEPGGAMMIWPKGYAGFVDDGTSRSRAFPFSPKAAEVAEATLEHWSIVLIDAMVARVSGR
jgi:hypothetical protein